MTGTCDVLFVYGTLMSTASGALGRAQRERLEREGTSLGPASIVGRLYDLGRYPGLVDGEEPDLVWGEALRLGDPSRSLRWLDRYEGIVPGRHDHNEYNRLERAVRLESGERLIAWVYLYARDVSPARRIGDGRWVS